MKRSVAHAALLGLLLLVGCETAASRPTFPDIRFTNEPRLRVDVAAVDLQDAFHASFRFPNVEHLFPIPPEHAMQNWAEDRLEATGTMRRLRVRIVDASVTETELPRTKGLTGAFTTDQAQRYDAKAAMSIDILDDRGLSESTIEASVSSTRSVPEGLTPNQRDETWYAMTKDLMTALDRQLEQRMRETFALYVR
jgi:hypothetical protein